MECQDDTLVIAIAWSTARLGRMRKRQRAEIAAGIGFAYAEMVSGG
jgi:hypothetical protein